MQLKIAKENDHAAVLDMSLKFFATTQYGHLPVDPEIHNTLVTQFLQSDNRERVCLLYHVDGKPVGLLAGQITPVPFLARRAAIECMWWVDPQHRGTSGSTDLLGAFEYWADLQGADFVQMMCLPNRIGKALDRYYTRRGYQLTELTYIKEL